MTDYEALRKQISASLPTCPVCGGVVALTPEYVDGRPECDNPLECALEAVAGLTNLPHIR